jgi:excisionase family DNA binding protein
MTSQETSRRLTVQEAAEVLGTSVDAVRMRVRRGNLRSDKDSDGRVYVWVDTDESETKLGPNGKSEALISAKDETIALLREQLEAERQAHSEARRLLLRALERIPPALEAPETAEPRSDSPTPTDAGEGRETASERPEERSWWRRMFGG